jgi:hypothetical protein
MEPNEIQKVLASAVEEVLETMCVTTVLPTSNGQVRVWHGLIRAKIFPSDSDVYVRRPKFETCPRRGALLKPCYTSAHNWRDMLAVDNAAVVGQAIGVCRLSAAGSGRMRRSPVLPPRSGARQSLTPFPVLTHWATI